MFILQAQVLTGQLKDGAQELSHGDPNDISPCDLFPGGLLRRFGRVPSAIFRKLFLVALPVLLNNNNRSAKSIDLVELEDSVENATNVMSRQEAIDKFLIRKGRDILIERTLKWNVGETARTFINSIPKEIKAKFTTYVTEARGKGKKLIRILVPLLIGLKLKMAAMSALTYLGIAFLAKKAILASFISLIVSGFIGLKKLMAAKQVGYPDIAPTYHPVPVWNPHGVVPGAMWQTHYDNHADPLAAQQLAYGNSKSR
ncbi:Osiris 9 [Carabus blaptoides fortunei]